MMKRSTKNLCDETIRQKAERLFKLEQIASKSDLSEAEIHKLLHELQVHQIELELQNEELIEAKKLSVDTSNKYTELYDFAPTGYFTLSNEGRIIELNLSGANFLGKERSLLVNSDIRFFITPASTPLFNLFLERVFATNTKETCEITMVGKENQPIYIYLKGIVHENGQQCLISMVDVTDLKLAGETLRVNNEFQKLLLQTIPFGMHIVDEKGNILFLSDKFKLQFGDEAIGKKCWELYLDNKKQCNDCPLHFGINIGETQTYETSGVLGGKTFEIFHTGIFYKGQKAILEIFVDITDRKLLEIDLINAKEHAEESDHLKTAFLANMSHEIRTPMNSIMGFASLLPDEASKDLMANYASIIYSNSEQLVHIIDDIILYSSLQTKLLTFFPKKMDVQSLLKDVIQSFSCPGFNNNIELKIETESEAPLWINSDYEKLKQIFTNLVSNAFKYTCKGSITIGFKQPENNLEFFVSDTGIGIPPDELGNVFNRFFRARNVIKCTIAGTGLGLSIVKELIELLGGKIWVESILGEGSVFYFMIPANFKDAN